VIGRKIGWGTGKNMGVFGRDSASSWTDMFEASCLSFPVLLL
jgi:hypothetical protein